MKQSKHISDEVLAAYLEEMLNDQNMPLDAIADVETLEVLSVSREAMKDTNKKTVSLPSWEDTSESAMQHSIRGRMPSAQAGFLGEVYAEEEDDKNTE